MSETEVHKGKLIPLSLNGVTMEERAKNACEKYGYEKSSWHRSYLECLRDEGYKTVYVRGDIIYEMKDLELDACGFSDATKNEDNTIDYLVMFYNGGASLDEVIDEAIDRAEE